MTRCTRRDDPTFRQSIAVDDRPSPALFPTRPEDYRRDQYDPRDFAEEDR